jgi:2-polyprenyl-3-methyl-5-hydroxy-6-metoxy-1,4-benzoquinol methylase
MNLWQILDHPVVWEISRYALDIGFSLYRKRVRMMHEWGILSDAPSIVDVGCGIGSYAEITKGRYLGIDQNCRFVEYARRKHKRPNQSFRCINATTLVKEQSAFELALMVDFLHHLEDEQCVQLLKDCSRLANQYVISFEPITYQPNPVGRWIVEHDRGEYPRSLDELYQFFKEAELDIVKSVELRLGPINTRAILARKAVNASQTFNS